jgi:hypothetical protein
MSDGVLFPKVNGIRTCMMVDKMVFLLHSMPSREENTYDTIDYLLVSSDTISDRIPIQIYED